jgi:geranylgeranyl pyrophosphate synthase
MVGRRWNGESGLIGDMCRHALAAQGKLFRPILLLQSAAAVGGAVEHVLPAALGTEVGHIASLVHDDIIDADEMRRGQPSVQAKFGLGNAIVAGDALLFDLFLCLAQCRQAGAADDRIVTALEVVARAGIDLCRGQSMEAELTVSASRDLPSYIEMIRLKTGALFSGACQVGAILGGGSASQVGGLERYGYELGIAFQICDDLLAYTQGSDEAIGKSLTSDLRNRRMTLPIILAYRDGTPEVVRVLDEALHSAERPGSPDCPSLTLASIRCAIDRSGGIERSRSVALTHASRAQNALNETLPSGPYRDCLKSYARRAVNRVR